MALWVAAVCLENEGESVAWRQDGLGARVMPFSRVLDSTKLSQDLMLIENLKDHISEGNLKM